MTATTAGRLVDIDSKTPSLAIGQRAVHDPSEVHPLWPPLTAGAPRSSTDVLAYPLEVDYDYDALTDADRLFGRELLPRDVSGWAELLPPLLSGLSEGIGSTPLVQGPDIAGRRVLVKDESRNPTWSHKDRLNLCTVSAAALAGAPGVVVASSGNHGASAAALAARAGLPCVVVMIDSGPLVPRAFVAAYGAKVMLAPRDERWPLVRAIEEQLGFQPLSNQTVSHTGHPFGPEGYKTIAYELFVQLGGQLPGAVFVPTGYGEMLYGVWKGFEELRRLGVTDRTPAIYACEVAAHGVLATGLRDDDPTATVDAVPTDAYSVANTAGGYRGIHVMRRTAGAVLGLDDQQMKDAQRDLASAGLWQEMSGAISAAGARKVLESGAEVDGPIVCIGTSTGLKDMDVMEHRPVPVVRDLAELKDLLT